MNQSLVSVTYYIIGVFIFDKIVELQGFVSEDSLVPFGESIGDSRFLFGDDNTKAVAFTHLPFKLFNNTFWTTHISGNGLISFKEGFSNSRPECTTGEQVRPVIIMAFWADANQNVDPTGSQLTYRETTDSTHLRKITRVIRNAFPQHRTINLTWLFVVTWKNIAQHDSRGSQRNTFQLILATNGISSFVLLYYNRIMWGGGHACAGIDGAGERKKFEIPGCCSTTAEYITETSNINEPGKWVFQVDTEIILPHLITSTCEKTSKPTLRLEPSIMSIMGNMPLFIYGLCLEEWETVVCVFQDQGLRRPSQVKGILTSNLTICPVPFLYSLGHMTVNILVSHHDQSPVVHSEKILIVKEHEFSVLPIIHVNITKTTYLLSAQWNPAFLSMTSILKADAFKNTTSPSNNYCQILSELVQIVVLEYDGKSWRNLGSIIPPILNNGIHMSPLNMSQFSSLLQRKEKILLRTLAIQTNYTLASGESVHKIIPANNLLVTNNLIDLTVKLINETRKTDYFSKVCQTWIDHESNVHWDTLVCPNTVEQAHLDWRFILDRTAHSNLATEPMSLVYVQRVPSLSGAASQCVYDNKGRLNQWIPGGGRMFRWSPNSVTGYWKHYLNDLLPHLYCCKWGNSAPTDKCVNFYSKRTGQFTANYLFPQPFRLVGGSHVTTFDGISYSFNGGGDYWMIRYKEDKNDNHIFNEFNMQVRTEIFVSENKGPSNASVITAVVMEETTNEYDVRVLVAINNASTFKNGLSIWVDDELVKVDNNLEDIKDDEYNLSSNDLPWNFENEFTICHAGVIIVIKSSVEVVVSFVSGISFNFIAVADDENVVALNIVGSAAGGLKTKVNGLLGGDISNDFKLPNITSTVSQANSTTKSKVGMQWLVNKNESLFQFSPKKSYRNRPTFSPRLMTTDQSNDFNTSDEVVCNNFQDCIFDYLATGSKAIAEGTMGTSALFQELTEISKKVFRQCTRVITPINGRLVGTSFVEGSSIQIDCYTNLTYDKYTCTVPDEGGNNQTPIWLNANGVPYTSTSFSCSLGKDTEINETKYNMKKGDLDIIPTSKMSKWVVFLGVFALIISIVVIIMKYPQCLPVTRFFGNRYRRYRLSNMTMTNEDGINLN